MKMKMKSKTIKIKSSVIDLAEIVFLMLLVAK